MANEAQVRVSLQIRKGLMAYQSSPTSFNADVAGSKGRTPGTITVGTNATNVDLSQLTTPGLVWLQNLDASNYVEWGVHDGLLFHPLGEILPGECYVLRLSRNLGEEEQATGTGTTGVVNSLCLRANGAACRVTVDAFER